jgi:hypothetical protein
MRFETTASLFFQEKFVPLPIAQLCFASASQKRVIAALSSEDVLNEERGLVVKTEKAFMKPVAYKSK